MVRNRTSPNDALAIFIQRALSSPVGGRILRLFHFGSTYRGDWHEESDIDVLVVATGHLAQVRDSLLDLSWDVLEETRWRVEPLVYCPEAWERPNFSLKSLMKEGKEVYSVDEGEEQQAIAGDLVQLALAYLRMAEKLDLDSDTRGVVDLAYNAAELVAKAWLVSLGEAIPRTHNGLVARFGERVVREGHIPPEVGRRLNRALAWRNLARYDPHGPELLNEAREVLALARALLETWERRDI